MRLALARAAIALASLTAIALLVAAPFVPVPDIVFGLSTSGSPGSTEIRVTGVTSGSIAARAGIRAGDVLRLDPDTPDESIRLATLRAGEKIAFVGRDGRHFVLSDPSPKRTSVLQITLQSAIFLTYAAMALLIVRRRSDDRRALELAAFLALFALGSGAGSLLLHVRSYWWILTGIAAQSAYALGGGFATLFAASFPRPFASGFRAFVRRAAPAVTLLAIVLTIVSIGGRYVAPENSIAGAAIGGFAACWAFFIFGAVGSLLVTLRESTGLERQQLLWIALTFGFGFSGLLVIFATVLFWRDRAAIEAVQYASLTVAVIPVGLTYVILRHRVVDVGFALNRAAVFGAVSFVVVGLFVALEWFISKYLLAVGHVASSAVELAVALAIGFSLRPVHARIDRIVDDLFFRKRHEAEQRLRRFARELPFFTGREAALERTHEVVAASTEAVSLAVYERAPGGFRNAGSGSPAFLDENDAAVVSFKAWHEPVSLYESGSALGDGLAFGLQVREETLGFLVLGPKAGGEDYAPDERDALEAVARSLAALLDALEIAELRRKLADSRLQDVAGR